MSGFSTEPWNINEQGINRVVIIPLGLRKGANYDSKYTIPSSNSGIGQVLIYSREQQILFPCSTVVKYLY